MTKEKLINQLSYEEALSELEVIVAALDIDQKPLDESIKLYERGQALSDYCANLLDQAELKITKISQSGDEEIFEG